jgi:hypothetical protein
MIVLSMDNVPIEAICPVCDFFNEVNLKQVRLRDVVICRGCKASIQLEDYMNECRKAERVVKETFMEWTDRLKS